MKRIFIWLDDERPINPIWIKRANDDIYFIKFKNALELIEWYQTKSNEYDKIFISFDHDLGSGFTGYDVAKFIVDNKCNLTGFAVHSMNPVGAMNIVQLLTHYGYYKMNYTGEINTL
jgi:hypothetical protein